MRCRFIWAIGIALAMPWGTSAQVTLPGGENAMFRIWDKNGDGVIERSELTKRVADDLLGRLDANKDGKLTAEEFRVGKPKKGAGPLAQSNEVVVRWDQDHDGRVSPLETPEAFWPYFARADNNEDGVLTDAEFNGLKVEFKGTSLMSVSGYAYEMHLLDESGKQRVMSILDLDGNGTLEPGEIPLLTHKRNRRLWSHYHVRLGAYYTLTNNYKHYDRNKNKHLESKELTSAFWKYFDILDINHDSILSNDEIDRIVALKVYEWIENEDLCARLDRDGDGAVSDAETPKYLRNYVPRIDLNNDGVMTPDEFVGVSGGFNIRGELRKVRGHPYPTRVAPRQHAMVVKTLDQDNDGRLGKSELPEFLNWAFYRLDLDDSGALETNEYTTNLWFALSWYDSDRNGLLEGEEMSRLGERKPPLNSYKGQELFSRLDKNRDGRLSQREAPILYTSFPLLWDDNENLEIDADELSNIWQQFPSNSYGAFIQAFYHPPLKPVEKQRLVSVFDADGDGELIEKEMPYSVRRHVKELDKDENGKISVEEMTQKFLGFFRYADIDQDGEVTAEEFRELRTIYPERVPKHLVSMRRHLDTNGNFVIEPHECPPSLMVEFSQLDHNRSGVLESAEYGKLRFMVNQDNEVVRVGGIYVINVPSMGWVLDALDRDVDGSFSIDELPDTAAWRSEFKRADVNRDGELLFTEMDNSFWRMISRFDSNLDRQMSPSEIQVLREVCRQK
ncbi:MAG: hypothetical protein ACPGVU_19070 [Limisphaerales bacterium]